MDLERRPESWDLLQGSTWLDSDMMVILQDLLLKYNELCVVMSSSPATKGIAGILCSQLNL